MIDIEKIIVQRAFSPIADENADAAVYSNKKQEKEISVDMDKD
jgi:hypothetical protein